MATKNAQIQKIYVRPETAYGDTTADFSSDGIVVRTSGLVDIASVKTELVETGVVKISNDDAGGAPVLGLDGGEVKLMVNLVGNTKAIGELTEDNLSKYLGAVVGTRAAPLNETALADCTTTVIKATGHPYVAGSLVMSGGEVRRVNSDDGADQFTLDFALTAAPGMGADIYGVETFETVSNKTVGVGISQVDSEMQFAVAGANPSALEVPAMTPGALVQLGTTIQVGKITRGALTPATAETGVSGLVIGRSGPGVQIKLANGSIFEPRVASVTCGLGVTREWDEDIGGTMGKGGTVAAPTDAMVEILCSQDTVYSVLETLRGSASVVNVQVGSASGGVVGVYYPEAYISDGPTCEPIGVRQGCKVTFRASRGILYRC
jgi:hypothetical protein